MATLAVTRRLDLTDEHWARLEPLLPVPHEVGSAVGVDETAAHRRDQVAGADRCALAGRPGLLRLLAGGVCAVPAVAAGRSMAQIVTPLQTRAD